MGTDAWRIFSEWLDHWRLSKRMNSFVLEGKKPSTQARFVADERDGSPDTKQLVKDVVATSGRSVHKRPPTPGPRRGRSMDRKDTKLSLLPISPRIYRPEGWHGRSSSAKWRPIVTMGQCSVTTANDKVISLRTSIR